MPTVLAAARIDVECDEGNRWLAPSVFRDDHVAIAYGMGITAEKVAEEWKVSREDQDAFALASHQKALAAIAAGEFTDEISAYEVMSHVPDLAGNTVRLRKRLVDTDEGPRPDTTKTKVGPKSCVPYSATAVGEKNSVTAGNSSRSEGAGAVGGGRFVASRRRSRTTADPLARFVSSALRRSRK